MPDRYAIVRAGVVENVVLWDGKAETWQPPAGVEMVKSDTAGRGDSYDSKTGNLAPAAGPPTVKSDIDTLTELLVQKQIISVAEADSIKEARTAS